MVTVNDLRQDWGELADDFRMRIEQLETSPLIVAPQIDAQKLTEDWRITLTRWTDELDALRIRYGAE